MDVDDLCTCNHGRRFHERSDDGSCDQQLCMCPEFEHRNPSNIDPGPLNRETDLLMAKQVTTEYEGGSKVTQKPVSRPGRKMCACGHREGVHDMDKDFHTCRVCMCSHYDELEVKPAAEPKPRTTPKHGGDRTTAEAGTWRALVEDLSTGALYLVARGSEKFVERSMKAYIDANPLPLTKRGVLAQDFEYVKAAENAPFFRGTRNGLGGLVIPSESGPL